MKLTLQRGNGFPTDPAVLKPRLIASGAAELALEVTTTDQYGHLITL